MPFTLFKQTFNTISISKPQEGPTHPVTLVNFYETMLSLLTEEDILNYSLISKTNYFNFLTYRHRLFDAIYISVKQKSESKLINTYNKIIFDDKYIPFDKLIQVLSLRISCGIFLFPWIFIHEYNKDHYKFDQATMAGLFVFTLAFIAVMIKLLDQIMLGGLRAEFPIYANIDTHKNKLVAMKPSFKTSTEAMKSIQELLGLIEESPIPIEEETYRTLKTLRSLPSPPKPMMA